MSLTSVVGWVGSAGAVLSVVAAVVALKGTQELRRSTAGAPPPDRVARQRLLVGVAIAAMLVALGAMAFVVTHAHPE